MLRHPFVARQVTLERPPGPIGFMFRIKMQHDACDFTPVSAFRIRVEQTQIRDQVLLIVQGQHGIGGRGISDIGIKWRLLHGCSRNRLLINQFYLGLLGILMTSKSSPNALCPAFHPVATKSQARQHIWGVRRKGLASVRCCRRAGPL